MNKPVLNIAMLVPGGILPHDHVHRGTNDGTCSRCRWTVSDDEVPLLLSIGKGDDLLIYCKTCLEMSPMMEGNRS